RDESELRVALENLAEAARNAEAFEEERQTLSQLIMIAPHETRFAQRLQEIKTEHGIEETEAVYTAADEAVESRSAEVPVFDNFSWSGEASSNGNGNGSQLYEGGYGEFSSDFEISNGSEKMFSFQSPDEENGSDNFAFAVADDNEFDEYIVDGVIDETEAAAQQQEDEAQNAGFDVSELKLADEMRLTQEIESVEFYIAQGYKELAEKNLSSLEEEFGNRQEFAK